MIKGDQHGRGLGDKRGAACERVWVIKGEQHVRGSG